VYIYNNIIIILIRKTSFVFDKLLNNKTCFYFKAACKRLEKKFIRYIYVRKITINELRINI